MNEIDERLRLRIHEMGRRVCDAKGPEHQFHKAAEECSELAAALNRWLAAGEDSDAKALAQVVEECADVTIMVKRLREMIGPARVDAEIEHKLDRTEQRLEAGTL